MFQSTVLFIRRSSSCSTVAGELTGVDVFPSPDIAFDQFVPGTALLSFTV